MCIVYLSSSYMTRFGHNTDLSELVQYFLINFHIEVNCPEVTVNELKILQRFADFADTPPF